MRTRIIQSTVAGIATSLPNGKHRSFRSVAAVCLRLWHGVPVVGFDLLIGMAVFAVIRIPVAEFGNTFDRIVTPQVPTSVLDSGAYWAGRMVVDAASYVLIGWIIGGLSSSRRARALVGAIAYTGFWTWWYSSTAQVPPSQTVAHLAREFINIAIVIGGIVVGYRLWSNRTGC